MTEKDLQEHVLALNYQLKIKEEGLLIYKNYKFLGKVTNDFKLESDLSQIQNLGTFLEIVESCVYYLKEKSEP